METVAQAATRWKVGKSTVNLWAKKGIISAEKFSGVWMIKQRNKPKLKSGRPFKDNGDARRG